MSVTSVDKDFDSLTLTLVADFDASIDRVWRLWSDPRLLEQWWGPPSWPAKVAEHDLTVGGVVTYVLTGPEGEESRGRWRVSSVDPPNSLEFVVGMADQDGAPRVDMPTTTMQVQLSEHGGGTRMRVRAVFDTREQMEFLARIGATEIFAQAVGQMDALLVA